MFLGFRLNVLRGWEDFKDDTPTSLNTVSQGNNPNDLNQLNSFLSSQAYHGTSPYWRVALFREGAKSTGRSTDASPTSRAGAIPPWMSFLMDSPASALPTSAR